MKITITVQPEGMDPWDETYERTAITTQEQAEAWAKALLAGFNNSRRQGEKFRALLAVKAEPGKPHRDDCPNCKGTGRAEPECEECEGNGWVDDPEDGGTMTCPSCLDLDCHHCTED